MKRLAIVVVTGLCSLAPAAAQEGTLAPTVPVIPSPVLQGGKLINPDAGGSSWGAMNSPRMYSIPRWFSSRQSLAASTTGYVTPPAAYNQALPPLPPTVIGNTEGSCASGNCGHARGSFLQHLKEWLTFHPSNTELPRCHPVPYITPLQGMFPCGSGCNYGYTNNYAYYGQPRGGYPLEQPAPNAAPMPAPLPPPMQLPSGSGPGAGVMPTRGIRGKIQSWLRGSPDASEPEVAEYRFATPGMGRNSFVK